MSQSLSSRRHYLKFRSKRLAENAARKKSCKRWLREYKESRHCEFCTESCSYCLDFHHLDPNSKLGNIATLANRGWSVESLLIEISKCILLCANCHRKLHHGYIAQLGEQVLCKDEAAGSTPVISTIL